MASNTTAHLFTLAIRAEREARDFYRELARKFQHIPEAESIWEELERDEKAHIQALLDARSGLTPEQLQASVNREVMWKAQAMQDFSVEKGLEASETLTDAYQLAHKLEHSEVNTVFEFMMTEFVDEEDQRAFVTAQLREHLAKLDRMHDLLYRINA